MADPRLPAGGCLTTYLAETQEVHDAVAEVAESRVELPYEVQREPIVCEDKQEEDAVDEQVKEVSDQLEVEDVGGLGLPPPLEAQVNHRHNILEEELHNRGGLLMRGDVRKGGIE